MDTVGQQRFARMNEGLNAVFARHDPVIVAHRGTAGGAVTENTADAAHAAFLSGADIVEIDVISSSDGEYFVFHTGTESRNLGTDTALEALSAAEISRLEYRARGRGGRPQGVERLDEFLFRFRGVDRMFNIDRSWHLWPRLLDALRESGMADRLLLKSPADEGAALDAIATHDTPFPFMAICRSIDEVEAVAARPGLNLVGVELIATDEDDPFISAEILRELHTRGLFTFANAEVLGDPGDLFAGYDDQVSMNVHPDLGWGRLLDLGVRAIQTDWPWLLREYRAARATPRAAAR